MSLSLPKRSFCRWTAIVKKIASAALLCGSCLVLFFSAANVQGQSEESDLQIAIERPPSPRSPKDAFLKLNRTWEKVVRPILATHCLECHNVRDRSGKLEMETVAGLVRGGLTGTALDLQNPAESLLLEVVSHKSEMHMPPEGQLDDATIASLRHWIIDLSNSQMPKEWLDEQETKQETSSRTVDTSPGASIPLGLSPSAVIDLFLEASWKKQGVVPASVVDDSTFARRLYLDLAGRIPRESELRLFVESTDSRKRDTLVDTILASDEHATHFAEVLDAILIGRTDADQWRKRSEAKWIEYLTQSIHQNRPWNLVAKEIVLARPSSVQDQGATWYLYARQNKHQEIAEAISKDFFGLRIDCAQCHDHPLASEILQEHYWGLVAFFNRGKNADTTDGPRVAESAIGGFSEFTNLRGKSAPNQLVFFRSPVVVENRPDKETKEEDRDELYYPAKGTEPKIPKFSRREQFVENILSQHPLLAQAMVNRLWAWMFGRGLIHPVDAMDSFHPASHPELLDWLARDFANSNYDLRRMLRGIALSRAYQLGTKSSSFDDPKWFASALAKPLTAEALYRSMQTALELDSNQWNSVEQRISFATAFPDVLAEESLATSSQGLMLTNGEMIQRMISAENSPLVQRAVETVETIPMIQQLFSKMLGRPPTEEELAHCSRFVTANSDRRKGVEGLVWALLTSAEFRFNH